VEYSRAPHSQERGAVIQFDRRPQGFYRLDGWVYQPDGTQAGKTLPDLIPPTAATDKPGVFVTREALTIAWLSQNHRHADSLADALGIPPDPLKVVPWEAAYEAWIGSENPSGDYSKRGAWQAAVKWCVAQVDPQPDVAYTRDVTADRASIRACIMGDA
jgi:hypothetical protein